MVSGDRVTYDDVVGIGDTYLLPVISERYGLEGYDFSLVKAGEGGRNVVYVCEKEDAPARIVRISFLNDRRRENILGEAEYISYLFENGGSVSNVVGSQNGDLLQIITHEGNRYFACVFEKANGKRLAENNYQYREGVPLEEYFFNCGKVLGKIHRLSKEYTPVHRRYSFLEKYNSGLIDDLIPGSFPLLKVKLLSLLESIASLDRDHESFGMIHFDYNDGNYAIDFDTGLITVFDFDNSCFGWYMYDLADMWRSGVGWVQFEPDAGKRSAFMDTFFATALAGYRSETTIAGSMLDQLPLFINATIMENIVDELERMRTGDEEPELDADLLYLMKCIEDDIPFVGFFHQLYSCETPFELGMRDT